MALGFHPVSVRCLREAGWHPERRIDVSECERAMERHGVRLQESARRFLETFGKLELRYSKRGLSGLEGACHFHADVAVLRIDSELLDEYQQFLDCKLSVVGACSDGETVLLMDEKGAVYGGIEETLFVLGQTGVDAINALCMGQACECIQFHVNPATGATELAPLSSQADKALREGGWCHERISRLDKTTRNGHCSATLPPPVSRFLREFEGISISIPAIPPCCGREVCRFSHNLTEPMTKELFADITRSIGCSVYPIGEVLHEYVLLMNEVGYVLLLERHTSILRFVAHTGYGAIHCLCIGISYPIYPETNKADADE